MKFKIKFWCIFIILNLVQSQPESNCGSCALGTTNSGCGGSCFGWAPMKTFSYGTTVQTVSSGYSLSCHCSWSCTRSNTIANVYFSGNYIKVNTNVPGGLTHKLRLSCTSGSSFPTYESPKTLVNWATMKVHPAPLVSITPPNSVFPYDEVNPSMAFGMNQLFTFISNIGSEITECSVGDTCGGMLT